MDIHKPKAAHSLREFLIEIGTIVTGILIALSLEAMIEAYREHGLVEHARAALSRELAANRRSLAGTVAQQKTAIGALDVLIRYEKDRLAGKASTLPANLELSIIFSPMNTGGWEATVATQALAHVPYGEAHDLARAYAGSRSYNEYQTDAVRHWYELSTLPDDLTSASGPDLKSALYQCEINRAHERALEAAGEGLLAIYDTALADLPTVDRTQR